MAKHSICHVEWFSTAPEKTKTFLTGLFEDWKFTAWGDQYLLFNPPSCPGVGIYKTDRVNPGKSPVVYIEVESIEPYLKKALELGGTVATETTEIPQVGWYAKVKDEDGNIYGFYENKKKK
jgi:uncharacterized protein